jgi:PGF-CTERM protein
VTTEIADAAPSSTGTTVEFSQSAVDAITFSGTASGTISIDDYEATTPPGAPDTGPRPVMAGVTIDAPSDVADQSATIRLTVDQTELLRADADPDEVAVLRATNGGYETLETTVVDDTGDVTLEAETSGFASFIVSTDEGDIGLSATPATQSPADESGTGAEPTPSETTQEETSPETTTTPPAEDQPGFGVIVAVTAMLIAGLLAVRRRLGYSSD